jgi:hypothetical protein
VDRVRRLRHRARQPSVVLILFHATVDDFGLCAREQRIAPSARRIHRPARREHRREHRLLPLRHAPRQEPLRVTPTHRRDDDDDARG